MTCGRRRLHYNSGLQYYIGRRLFCWVDRADSWDIRRARGGGRCFSKVAGVSGVRDWRLINIYYGSSQRQTNVLMPLNHLTTPKLLPFQPRTLFYVLFQFSFTSTFRVAQWIMCI